MMHQNSSVMILINTDSKSLKIPISNFLDLYFSSFVYLKIQTNPQTKLPKITTGSKAIIPPHNAAHRPKCDTTCNMRSILRVLSSPRHTGSVLSPARESPLTSLKSSITELMAVLIPYRRNTITRGDNPLECPATQAVQTPQVRTLRSSLRAPP